MQPTHDPATLDPAAPAAVEEATPARTLRDAARYLRLHGWVQGSYYEPDGPVFNPAACMVGAIGMVCYGSPVDAPALHTDDPGWDDFADARDWLDAVLEALHGQCSYGFNDARGRIAEAVIAALDLAADMWDRMHGGAL
jgi:hypothetical protein